MKFPYLNIQKFKIYARIAIALSFSIITTLAYSKEEAKADERSWYEYDKVKVGETQTWFEDAKLGIFIHWGIYSVPGYAPVDNYPDVSHDLFDFLWLIIKNGGMPETSYAEWYKSNLNKGGSTTERFHREQYGTDFGYYDFAPLFNESIKQWQPANWAQTFREIGAKYVVLTSKHHDGFTLWPSAYPSAGIPQGHGSVNRDVVEELTSTVRAEGLAMGLYFSGGIDWSYDASYDFSPLGWHDYPSEFIENTDNQLQEIITQYRPDIIWNDIGYPKESQVIKLIEDYRKKVPHGVINNRWREVPVSEVTPDFGTPEYATHSEIQPFKWETSRGLGYSYGYNRMDNEETTLSSKELVHFLIDVVSKNGNLLLNIGPKADGSIPAIQLDRLQALGKWLSVNGSAIYGTRPWSRAEGKTGSGIPIRFTQKKQEKLLYAALLEQPPSAQVLIKNLDIPKESTIKLLGHEGEITWQKSSVDIVVSWPEDTVQSHAYVLEFAAP